jgi:hypothetical protein
MENFDFYIDRKVSIWVREFHSLEAESLEEAKEKMLEEFDNGYGDYLCDREEFWDTYTELTPSQNGGNSTAELYFEKTNQLIKNNKD